MEVIIDNHTLNVVKRYSFLSGGEVGVNEKCLFKFQCHTAQ